MNKSLYLTQIKSYTMFLLFVPVFKYFAS